MLNKKKRIERPKKIHTLNNTNNKPLNLRGVFLVIDDFTVVSGPADVLNSGGHPQPMSVNHPVNGWGKGEGVIT